MRILFVFFASSLLLIPSSAIGQTTGEEPGMAPKPPPASQKTAGAPSAAATEDLAPCRSPGEVEAQAYYDKAIRAMVDGKLRRARKLLQVVITRYQRSRYFIAAKEKLAAIDSTPQAAAESHGRDSSGRVELIIGNSLLWVGYGMVAPLLFTDDFNSWSDSAFWSALGAGTAAGVGSLLLSSGRAIPDGWAHLHHFSQIWGSWTAFAVYAISAGVDDADNWSSRAIAATVLGGGVAGLAISLIFKDPLSVPRGEAEFVTSAAMWGSWLGFSTSILIMGEDIGFRGAMGTVLGLGTASIAAASIWTPPWSKSRIRYISLMGFGGLLLGNAILYAASSNEARVYGGVGIGTVLSGLALGVFVTRNMPDATPSRGSASLPALISYVDGELDWGVPLPKMQPLAYADGMRAGYFVDLAAGRF